MRMTLTTAIRPEDKIRIDDNEDEFVVANVQPNQFGGPDTVTYQDGDDEFVVSADRCSLASSIKR